MISSSVTDLPVLNSMNTATTYTRRLSATPIATACFTASCFTRIASTSAAGWTLTPSDSSSQQQTSMIKVLFEPAADLADSPIVLHRHEPELHNVQPSTCYATGTASLSWPRQSVRVTA